jgi:hypothetical protein
MNAFRISTTVTTIQTASTLMDLSCVLVAMDILEMELFAKVNIEGIVFGTKQLEGYMILTSSFN